MLEMQVYEGVLSGGAAAVGLCNQVVEWRLSLAGARCTAQHTHHSLDCVEAVLSLCFLSVDVSEVHSCV